MKARVFYFYFATDHMCSTHWPIMIYAIKSTISKQTRVGHVAAIWGRPQTLIEILIASLYRDLIKSFAFTV